MLAALLTWISSQAASELESRARQQVETLIPLLNASLSGSLMQRDYAELQAILDEARSARSFAYLLLLDRDGRRVASSGLQINSPLPLLNEEFGDDPADHVYDTTMDIRLVGVTYGRLYYGIDTTFLAQTRARVTRIGLLVGLGVMGLTIPLFALLGYGLTRRLSQLTEASHALASGNFRAELPTPGDDEVGQLAHAFQVMSRQLLSRLSELRDSEQRFYAIANYTYDLELWIDPAAQIIWVNPSVLRMTGYTSDECMDMAAFPLCLVAEADRDMAEKRFAEALRGSTGEGYQFRMVRKDGSQFWAAVNWHPIFSSDNHFLGVRASIRDVTDLKASEQRALDYLSATEAEQARLMALLSAMNLGIMFVGENGRVIYYNPAFEQIWNIPSSVTLAGMTAEDIYSRSDCQLANREAFMQHMKAAVSSREGIAPLEIQIKDGRVVNLLSFPVFERDERFVGHLWIFEDVTNERQTAEQLLYLAERDSLTGLYNRHRFEIELERMLAESVRHDHSSALLYFDLDEFKAINDHFGHKAGDALLIRVAGEVSGLTRRHEMLFRLGGDEFAVLMPNSDAQQAQALAERIVRAIAQIPFRFEGQILHISSSLGISLYPSHAADQEQLVVRADAAMYQAKQAGKNTWRLYRQDLDNTTEMVNRLSWNDRLNRALEQSLFELHFQGVYQADTRELAHLEALIRLRDEESGELVPPGRFIPVAEKSAKILEIDRWVLRQAVGLLAEKPTAPRIAVNISGRSFDDPVLPHYIVDLLREFGVAPERLIIEITETATVSDLTDAERFIEALKLAGCGVCLDDFGAGFASFAYLKHIRVDTIKLDGMFIRNLPFDHDNQVFVRGMVEVARGLGKATVAECVEDEATLRLLTSLGVNKAQGFFLDRPQARHPALFPGGTT
ncbi:MAG: EAL domain-containing protein [Thiobacillus sp.]|nr:EAL domain-containing protein [Thiobacillus sp.]